ncbi:MAG: phosphotransferase [Deltaproteobacteria bacterium]|nr:phosphotransferase [Deltaproteobacteria bacterium]
MSQLDATVEEAAAVLEDRWGFRASRVRAVKSGRVNQTFLAEREDGPPLILQRLNPIFGASPAFSENWDAVAAELAARGLACPALVRDRGGALLAAGSRWGEYWRLSTFVPGRSPAADGPGARLAGRCLGERHSALNRPRPLPLKAPSPSPFEEYSNQRLPQAGDFEDFARTYRNHPSLPRLEEPLARGTAEARLLPAAHAFQRIFLMKDLVVHLDPKRDNFLEDGEGACALIDWDTVSYGDPLLDLGELCRSFAARPEPPFFDALVMSEALSGYRETGLDMGERHFSLLPSAVRGICVNLSRRYLADALMQSHFVWDSERYPSLFEQNLARALYLLDLSRELREREFELMGLAR